MDEYNDEELLDDFERRIHEVSLSEDARVALCDQIDFSKPNSELLQQRVQNQHRVSPSQISPKIEHGNISAKKLTRAQLIANAIEYEIQKSKDEQINTDVGANENNSITNKNMQSKIEQFNKQTTDLYKFNKKIEIIENLHRYCYKQRDIDENELLKTLMKRGKASKKERERDCLSHVKTDDRCIENEMEIKDSSLKSQNNKGTDVNKVSEHSTSKSQYNKGTDKDEGSSNCSIKSYKNQDEIRDLFSTADSTITNVSDKLRNSTSQRVDETNSFNSFANDNSSCVNIKSTTSSYHNNAKNSKLKSTESTAGYISDESHNSSVQNQQNSKVFTRELPNRSTPAQAIQLTEVLKCTGDNIYNSFKFFDHLVLAHSKFSVVSIEKLEYMPLMEEILYGIKELGFKKVLRIQSYAWPHLLRGNSSIIISGAKSGKTYCYIPTICNLVAFRIMSKAVKNNYGPIAIILLSKADEIECVISICDYLLNKCGVTSRCVDAYGVRNLLETKMRLINGCPILVATPSSLRLILEENKTVPLIDGTRVKHFIMDDIDVMLDTNKDFLDVKKSIFKLCNKNTLQIVATSRVWKPVFIQYLQSFNDALLVIGDFLEAAIYNQTKIVLKLCGALNKIDTITQFLENHSFETQRSVVVCNSTEEVKYVHDALMANDITCFPFHSESDYEDFLTLKRNVLSNFWSVVLICTDDIVHEIPDLQNIVNLVHYSMPSSWTHFTKRFVLMSKNVKNIMNDFRSKSKESLPNTSSLILLDEENELQLPRLFNYINTHVTNKADIMVQTEKIISKMIETQRAKKALCPFLLNTETCDQPRCEYRHKFTESEIITDNAAVPTTGELRLTILKVISPTHYIAQLNELRATGISEWNVIRQSDMAGLFQSKLNLHYNMQTSLKVKWPLAVNDICVYDLSDVFYRVEVTHMPTITNDNIFRSVTVNIKFLDIGIVSTVQSCSLFICEEEFINFPPQAIHIRLLGVQPHNDERFWHKDITKFVDNLLVKNISTTDKVFAKINFSSNNCIWIDSVYVQEYLAGTRTWCIKENLKKSLVANNFVMTIPETQSEIRAIAMQCGLIKQNPIETPTVEVKKNEIINNIDVKQEQNERNNKCKDLKTSTEDKESQVNSSNIQQKHHSTELKCNDLSRSINCESNDVPSELNYKDMQYSEANISEEVISEFDSSLIDVDKESSQVHAETWIVAPLNTLIQVEYSDELNGFLPDIYVQLYDVASNTNFENLVNLTRIHVETLKASSKYVFPKQLLCPMENCIVKKDDDIYLRAKYYENYKDGSSKIIHIFFLCDYGGFLKISADELYNDLLFETTETITNYTPFQAVHCNLAGLQYKENTQNYLELSTTYLFIYPVKENRKHVFGINSYDVLLYETNTLKNEQAMELYNAKHVSDGNAKWDNGAEDLMNIKPNLSKLHSISYKSEMHTEDTRDYDRLLKIIEDIDLSDSSDANQNVLSNDCLVDKNNDQHFEHCSNTKSSITTGNTKDILYPECKGETETDIQGMPELKFSYVAPTTYWYETEHRICLKISAFDIESYQLKVTEKTLVYFAVANGKRCGLILNFLGLINANRFTYKLRGQYLYVHLLKSVFLKWPRILEQDIKYNWFLKDIDKINIECDASAEEVPLESFKNETLFDTDDEDEELNPIIESKDQIDDIFDDPCLDI